MTYEEAQKIVSRAKLKQGNSYIRPYPADGLVVIEGRFDAEELEAIAFMLREKMGTNTASKPCRQDYQIEQTVGKGDWLSVSEGRYQCFNPAYRRIRTVEVSSALKSQQDAAIEAKQAEQSAWQPIETAPKDGTPLLLFARYVYAEASIRLVGWHIEGTGWICLAFGDRGVQIVVPSFWMPLPEFPDQGDGS